MAILFGWRDNRLTSLRVVIENMRFELLNTCKTSHE